MADIMVLFGSGGHSSEMLMLIENAQLSAKLDRCDINKIICVISDDDRLVMEKINQQFGACKQRHKLETVAMQRPRKVGQSYLTSIWTTILGMFNSFNLVLTHKPQLCLTNGPAISVTISLAIRLLQLLTLGFRYGCNIIYVESFCRTRTLSLSGKLIYYLRLANSFYVQWQPLQARYVRTIYRGVLV